MSNEKVLMALRAAKTVSINDADVITPEMAQAFLDGLPGQIEIGGYADGETQNSRQL